MNFFGIIQNTLIRANNNTRFKMQNALFDELKDLKKDMAQKEKIENEKRASVIRDEKEKNLKDEFINFIKSSGVKEFDK